MDGSRGTFDRSSLRDDKKKQQKIVSNNLKKIPGGLFLRFFLTDEDDTDQSILRSLRPSGKTLRKLIAAIVTIGFTVVLIGDLLDLAISGTWRNSTYGRVSYIITAITFVPSQVSFTRCCASCIFLLARNKEIVRSIRFILAIRSGTTLARQSHERVLIVRARLFYAMVMTLSISALLLIFLDPVFWLHYPQKMQLYNFLSFRGFDIECYIRSLRILAAFVNTSVAVLLQILHYLYAEHAKMVLEKMSNCATGVHQPRSGVHREKMVQEVQKMRDSYEQLIGVKDCLERTFSMLLLIHIATIFMDIMIALAWLYTWSVVPSTGNTYLATKTILEGCGSLLRMVFLLATPLNLCLLVSRRPAPPLSAGAK